MYTSNYIKINTDTIYLLKYEQMVLMGENLIISKVWYGLFNVGNVRLLRSMRLG